MTKKKKKLKKKENKLKYEGISLICLALGLYSVYSLFNNNPGKIGVILKFILGFLFGKGAIIFVAIFICIYGFLLIKAKPFHWNKKIVSLCIVGINYCIFQYIFTIKNLISNPFSRKVFLLGWENALLNTGGGIIGLFLSSILTSLFSQIGAIIILVFSTIITFMVFTEKSFVTMIKYGIHTILNWLIEVKNLIVEFIKRPRKKDKEASTIEENSGNIKTKMNQLDEKIKILDYTKENINNLQNKREEQIQGKDTVEKSINNHSYISASDQLKYNFPSIDLLNKSLEENTVNNKKKVLNNAKVLETTLEDFGVSAKVVQVDIGPTITRYELHPSPGVKVSKIINLTDDIALNLATSGVRIEAPIPGKSAIGIEVPNQETSVVFIRELLDSELFKNSSSKLAFAVGKDIAGKVLVTDIAKMPHMLIAGATGSGKSVCINSLIASILYKSTPEEVRLILIDPKVVELSIYNGIPHLLIPVVTDPKKAAGALNWTVQEMNERYKKFAECNVRDIDRYNELFFNESDKKMPKIVVIIDELADLMMVSPREVEDTICRLAQMARAAGIHLVVATQRPSVDVITGVIKANIPSRIAFAVSSQMDSRTILDMGGAEKLLGRGDMLFYPVGASKPLRVQGAFISDKEVESIVKYVKEQNNSSYNDEIIEKIQLKNQQQTVEDESDELLPKAIDLAIENQQISISMLQRRLRIGYARAARLIDEMENRNIIGGYEGSKPRKVLISKEEMQQ